MVADLLLEQRVLKVVLEKTLSSRALRELLPYVLLGVPCLQDPPTAAEYGPLTGEATTCGSGGERALLAVFSRHPYLGRHNAKVPVSRLLAAQGLPGADLRRIRQLR